MPGNALLVVEDDPDIGALLERGLGAAGFAVTWVDSVAGATSHLAGAVPDAALLDVTLPDGTGHDLCRAMRHSGFPGPILFLSAKDEVTDRVDGLAAGGDDYIVKPFAFGELLARIRAQLMRHAAEDANRLEAGGLSLDLETRQAKFGEGAVRLTQREVELLALFMRAPNKPIARGDIYDRLWPDQNGSSLNIVDVYVGYIRHKLAEVVPEKGPAIVTVRGRGFMLETRA